MCNVICVLVTNFVFLTKTKIKTIPFFKIFLQKYYESLISGTELIESSLHRHLGEHLNAEVVLGTITDLAVALQWIRTTFLYVRAVKNPTHYGLQFGLKRDQVEKKLEG